MACLVLLGFLIELEALPVPLSSMIFSSVKEAILMDFYWKFCTKEILASMNGIFVAWLLLGMISIKFIKIQNEIEGALNLT